MPVELISFEDGILTIKESGRIDEKDAKHFEDMLKKYAPSHPKPIVVLIDARTVDVMMPAANKIFVRSATVPNVKLHVVVAGGLVATQSAQILSIRNYRRNTVIFHNWEEGLAHAREHAETADD